MSTKMMISIIFGFLVICIVMRSTETCVCMPTHPQEAFCHSDYAIRAKVVSKRKYTLMEHYKMLAAVGLDPRKPYYDIEITKILKGFEKIAGITQVNNERKLYSRVEIIGKGTSCDKYLETGKDYLLTGRINNGVMKLMYCDLSVEWDSLTDQMKNGFYGDYDCDCPIATCIDGYCDKASECKLEITWDKPIDESRLKYEACRKTFKSKTCTWFGSKGSSSNEIYDILKRFEP